MTLLPAEGSFNDTGVSIWDLLAPPHKRRYDAADHAKYEWDAADQAVRSPVTLSSFGAYIARGRDRTSLHSEAAPSQ